MKEGEGFLARIMPATRILQAIVGIGKPKEPLLEEAIKRFDETLASHITDNDEFLSLHLRELLEIKSKIKTKNFDDKILLNEVCSSLANFSANCSMLTNNKVHRISNIIHLWSESIDVIDNEFIELLEGYIANVEKISIQKDLSEKQILSLEREMKSACKRHFDRKNIKLIKKVDNSQNIFEVLFEEAKTKLGK